MSVERAVYKNGRLNGAVFSNETCLSVGVAWWITLNWKQSGPAYSLPEWARCWHCAVTKQHSLLQPSPIHYMLATPVHNLSSYKLQSTRVVMVHYWWHSQFIICCLCNLHCYIHSSKEKVEVELQWQFQTTSKVFWKVANLLAVIPPGTCTTEFLKHHIHILWRKWHQTKFYQE